MVPSNLTDFRKHQYIVIVDDSDNRSSRVDERPVFQKHLGIFVEAVWGLLTQLGVQPQFDKVKFVIFARVLEIHCSCGMPS